MFFKVEAIKIKMSLDRLYDELDDGKNLTEIFIALNKSSMDNSDMFILDEVI